MEYRNFPLFAGLESKEVESFIDACQPCSYDAGTNLIVEGEAGENLFFVLQGEVVVCVKAENGSEQEVATLCAPAILGELEALTGERRSATVRARTDVEALRLSFDELRTRLQAGDAPAMLVFLQTAKVIAHRLTALNRKFAELQCSCPVPQRHELRDFQEKLLSEWTV